ncbi:MULTISPECIES: sigma-70 family RNA polymerase sigma factor [unclassified Dyella]|uniref:sigma-70 family RNA polymerase sigma factor n=1 Tax=unclassified Dyella TaxID=2634549 RepID=UPI000C83B3CB|nr:MULTISPECIES: sigma-70 family RNA polymerase sigma factor [unclassified Dyella]MDR3443929.1 sigma-70 family RNA polymerase sigma factor [Dyella sp.]PMQ04772.1 putative RNA polymerase sigma factor FecI [Dyella sp. AD56]
MSISSTPASRAVEAMYADHHGWLRGWLRHRLGNESDAADLAQDTFVRVIRSRQAPEIRQPRDFLATVARGLVVDFFRRRTFEQAYLEALAQQPEPLAPSPEERATVIGALMEIDAMLDGLGAKVKRTFLLSQCDGLTYAAIAETVGISLRTVNNHMAKAMEHCCRLRLRHAALG